MRWQVTSLTCASWSHVLPSSTRTNKNVNFDSAPRWSSTSVPRIILQEVKLDISDGNLPIVDASSEV